MSVGILNESSHQDAETKPLLHATDIEKGQPPSKPRSVGIPFLSGAAYCTASIAMVLLNKMALSSFQFTSPNALLFFQCAMCVILVKLSEAFNLIKVEPFKLSIVRIWLPVNFIFVGMIGSSFWALTTLNVAMVTVLKNLTNIFTIAGDYYFYGRSYSIGVWACIALMLLSAIFGAATDLSFNARGYAWQILNCCFTAAYSLYLRGAMDRVTTVTSNRKRLNEFSMVFYNNLLSLPFLLFFMAGSGELSSLWHEPDLKNTNFLIIAALSGLLSFGISFTSLWFISTTTPTIYSLVGSLNKVPLAFLGLFLFAAPWSIQNLGSITVGLMAGVVFAMAKQRRG